MNALVLGAGGQLGAELVRRLGPATAVPHSELSITDAAAVETIIGARRPDVVFNCAAYNAVDRAESERDAALAVNGEGPRVIGTSCARHGAMLVHFSTNFVFDGSRERPYIETDEPAPLSVYAASKLEGEKAALDAAPRVLVIRTAAVFGGRRGDSFPEKILQRARAGEQLRVVADQRVNPTFTGDLAAAAIELAGDGVTGIVHAVAEGCCGWDDFARAVLLEAGVEAEVKSITSDAFPAAARRPLNGCLETVRFRPLRSWSEGVRDWASGLKKA